MQALEIRRDRPCRMNENEKGIVEPLLREKAPQNVTFIDKAPKKKKPEEETKVNPGQIKKRRDIYCMSDSLNYFLGINPATKPRS